MIWSAFICVLRFELQKCVQSYFSFYQKAIPISTLIFFLNEKRPAGAERRSVIFIIIVATPLDNKEKIRKKNVEKMSPIY
jgi:hypothetical protein